MGIPETAVLAAELHCLSEDGTQVITVQHWSDPDAPADRPLSWLRVLRNGQRVFRKGKLVPDTQYLGARRAVALATELDTVRKRFAATALEPDEARAMLRRLIVATPMAGVRGRMIGHPVSFK
jgi:hypothetical protein